MSALAPAGRPWHRHVGPGTGHVGPGTGHVGPGNPGPGTGTGNPGPGTGTGNPGPGTSNVGRGTGGGASAAGEVGHAGPDAPAQPAFWLRELRPDAPESASTRILFTVEPPGTAVLLAAGMENDWLRAWYAEAIPRCSIRYRREHSGARRSRES